MDNNKTIIIRQLLEKFPKSITIKENSLNPEVFLTFLNCFEQCIFQNFKLVLPMFEITSVLDYLHDELNTGKIQKINCSSKIFKMRKAFYINAMFFRSLE